MKSRNPKFGRVRIAQEISHAIGISIDQDVVRRRLAQHCRPDDCGSPGPSWLTLIARTKDRLWSLDLFRCESIHLRSYWVLVVMDVFTRRIIGIGIERGYIDGVAEIGRRSHLSREATYRMLSKGGNPELRSFTALLAGAGLRLSIRPVEGRVKKAS